MCPTKNDVNIFHKLAYFTSRGIGSRPFGPYIENKVDGTRQFIVIEKYRYIGGLVQKGV